LGHEDLHAPEIDVPDLGLIDGLFFAGTLALLVSALLVTVATLRRPGWSTLLVTSALGVGAMVLIWFYCQPVPSPNTSAGVSYCARGEPAAAIARLHGVPDDSVLTESQRGCRTRARLLLGTDVALALAGQVAVVGIWRRRSRRRLPSRATSSVP